MKFVEYSKNCKPKIDDQLGDFLKSQKERVNHPFLEAYYEELGEYLLTGGKRIRPLLTIATYRGFSSGNDDKILFPSIAVELLHNASLIHDDIIDNDELRRGKPAFHFRFKNYHETHQLPSMQAQEFGYNMGILGGDQVYFLGLEPLSNNSFPDTLNLEAIKHYRNVFTELCEGVLIEIDMLNRSDVTIENYIKMISLKTGALLEKSVLIGATYANAPEEMQISLSKYAINLGIIFQIKDDILGTFGDEKLTGKPTDGDIREGKKTSLLLAAKNKLDDDKRQRLESLIQQDELTEKDIEEVRNLFNQANALNFCKNLVDSHYKEALDALKKIKPSFASTEYQFLRDLLEFVFTREY
ncbi:MAG: polyprenyl synthetase family protein [Promethearchaeia archaeon]